MIFKGDDRFTPITYRAQHKIYVDAFKRVSIHTSKITHVNRKSALNMIAQENVSSDQQKMVGRWGHRSYGRLLHFELTGGSNEEFGWISPSSRELFFVPCCCHPSQRFVSIGIP
ncbi:hypothetical protein RMCBS344292_19116 [Rhizopus microsporus]|nr:hypothetical protein RMCBS344292_19116 [Rhizopus microsporus]